MKAAIVLCAMGFALLWPPSADAEGSFGIASLPAPRPAAGIAADWPVPEARRVGVPGSRIEAIALMNRVAWRLEEGSAAGTAAEQCRAELEAALRFARRLDRDGIGADSFQWHRAGVTGLGPERGRALIRPLSGIRYVSALAIKTADRVEIDRIRVYSASGMVFEFGAERRAVERRGNREVYLIEREIELVGVEVMYRLRPGSGEARLAIEGGICVEPRYAAECAYRLQMARQSVIEGRYDEARDRVRESIALLSTIR